MIVMAFFQMQRDFRIFQENMFILFVEWLHEHAV